MENQRNNMMTDYEFYKAITGLSDEDLELDEHSQLDCGNCFTAIPKWVLKDAGNYIYLNDYTCENCHEPLGS